MKQCSKLDSIFELLFHIGYFVNKQIPNNLFHPGNKPTEF